MNLFEHTHQSQIRKEAPLADRMRPRSIDEFVGQSHILAPGRLLRRAIQADQLSSLIFYGPPGTGKTTLARIIANTTQAEFLSINAVLSGVADIRNCIDTARKVRTEHQRRSVLFVDEVHRFNKAQQDAMLPHVENGTVILIGATTENPYFEVNKALVSRSRIFQLQSLTTSDIETILELSLADKERGFGNKKVDLSAEARSHLANVASGDARAALNALELAVLTSQTDSDEILRITLEIAEESIQRRAVLYDKDGDAHFDTISAFIKSMRGSDPDAALFWMAKMVEAGEDPRFIFRRMLIFASEDVGMADPQALGVVTSAAQAFDYVGMPEGRFHLAQACLYLSTAPKSNSAFAFFDAMSAVRKEQADEVPDGLKDASRDSKGFGHGEGYLYPHAYSNHWVAQQYLPDVLQGRIFYQPSEQGFEASVRETVAKYREAQLAVFHSLASAEKSRSTAYWEARTLGSSAELLNEFREKITEMSELSRNSLALVLNAGDGLLLGELIRQISDETVYALVETEDEQQIVSGMYAKPASGIKPIIAVDNSGNPASFEINDLCFERFVGRNVLQKQNEKTAYLKTLSKWISQQGVIILGENVPSMGQRLSNLIPEESLDAEFLEKLKLAEVAIYNNPQNPRSNWTPDTLRVQLESDHWNIEHWQVEEFSTPTMIRKEQIEQWFNTQPDNNQSSYLQELSAEFSLEQLKTLRECFRNELAGKMVEWSSVCVFMRLRQGFRKEK
ncbi:MAG: Replication-associated recombination protein A [Deltaproteobacteria bacterium]|nr:Replication-associated recombination protein A [Deltaproteobacteria bacterium]